MNRTLIVIAVAAFVLRLGYAVATDSLEHPQTWEQERIATNLVEHHAFLYKNYRAYAEPLYPFLVAAVYLVIGHSQMALVLLQLVIASAMVWTVGWAAMLATGSDAVSAIAALIMAVHPGFIRYSSILHPLVIDAFFFIAAAAMIVRYRQVPALGRGLAAAAVIGLGALTRPTILVFLLPLCWIRPRRAVIVAATALAVVAPWTIRNAVVFHDFVLTRSGTGYVFWLGNNRDSTGSAVDRAGRPIVSDAPPELRAQLVGADELARDRIFHRAAWDYIRLHPAAAVGRIGQRLYDFWWFSPQWGAKYSPAARVIFRVWWGALLVLIVIGAIASRNRDLLLMAALALLISLVQSLYYVEGRHRLAVEPLLFPLAAAGLSISARKVRDSSHV